MAGKYTAETAPYKAPGAHTKIGSGGPGGHASYTPSAAIDPFAYGKNAGAAGFNDPPSVIVGGASEMGVVPAMPGNLVIGEDKNVSTPVTG